MQSSIARLSLVAAGVAAAVALSGCTANDAKDADLVAGKQLFVQKCGACHTLNRAGTKGTTGPDLDEAFRRSLVDGFGEASVRGLVREQINVPYGAMPADLVKGQDADDVAAYVASVASRSGKDEGLLATAVKPAGSDKPAVQSGNKLTIAADPSGQLQFTNSKAEGKAGSITLDMPNKSGVPHNIAIKGKGEGKVVENGDSTFTATFAKGTYTYICEVPGHEEAGMKGTLTVK